LIRDDGEPNVVNETANPLPGDAMTAAQASPWSDTQGEPPLLELRDVNTRFFTRKGTARVLEDLSLTLGKGEIVGLVGESGSGKSVTGFSIVNLLKAPGKVVSGEIIYEGKNIANLPGQDMRESRRQQISKSFQNPRAPLTPVLSVGEQIG